MMQKRLEALLADKPARALLGLLNDGDSETRIVGGAVRNTLLGAPVSDLDLATTLPPDAAAARLQAAGYKVIPTGIAHGTITVVSGGRSFEVTTLREDVETDGRHATVRFGHDFAGDARRRDFTVNAMSLSLDGRLHDYCGGLADLEAHRIRFIGDARQRIREDYLRILRLFRFHAQYGAGPLDADGYAAAIAERDGLRRLSRERIRQEMLKLLLAPGAAATVMALAEAGLMDAVIGGVDWRGRFARLVAEAPEADAVQRLAALALAIREDVARLTDRLRLTRAEQARLLRLAELAECFHDRAAPTGDEAKALIYRAGPDGVRDAAMLLGAQGRDTLKQAAALSRRWSAPPPPFAGRDLAALGVGKGPAMGPILQDAEARWLAAGLPEGEGERLAILRAAVAAAGEGAGKAE
jgi:poly(A) polymerase